MNLPPNARVAVVAPGGATTAMRLDAGLDFVRTLGYEPVEARNLRARFLYHAGTLAQRAADLTWALTAPDIDAVWFARGGYGTAQTLAALPWGRLDGRPVLGFSDATALLVALEQHGVASIHAPVLQGLTPLDLDPPLPGTVGAASRDALRTLLATGRTPPLRGRVLCDQGLPVQGRAVGGNLTVLASLCGTPWQLRAQGAIVLFEDVGEAPYRIERSLCQLRDSGCLQGVAGIGLGEFTDCEPPGLDHTTQDMLRGVLQPLGVPVLADLPFGHGARNDAWVHGALADLDAQGLHFHDAPGSSRARRWTP